MNDDFKFPEMAPVPLMVKDLTMRDHFAGLAMQAYASCSDWRQDMSPKDTAFAAYMTADEMLKARDKK
jgi:hypothetical protein